MARSRNLSALLADTAEREQSTPAQTVPEPAAPADPPTESTSVSTATTDGATAAPAEDAPVTKRSTLDLPLEQHLALQSWAVDATRRLGRTVRGQHVTRALVARLLADEQLSAQVLADLDRQS